MRRREFITLFGGAVASWPVVGQAQTQGPTRRIGVLMSRPANDPVGQGFASALSQQLGALNWRNGDNLNIDWRWGGADPTLYQKFAAELVALGPGVLVANSSPAVGELRRHSSTIPIVFVSVTDPVGQGIVTNLARPGGTVTGFADYDPPMAGKWLGMLTQIAPPVARVGVLFNPTTAPYAGLMMRAIEDAAPSRSMTVRIAPVRNDTEIDAEIAGLGRDGGGLLVISESFTVSRREVIVAAAARHRVPAVYPDTSFARIGGLIGYGIDRADLFRRAAVYVDRILKGEKAGDLPVQNPTKFELSINLKAAKLLGITIAPSLLGLADEVIE